MAIGAVRRHPAVLGAAAADVGGVVRVEVQQHPAGLQHPEPLAIGPLRVRQRPGEVPADNGIEASVLIVQGLGVHLPERDVQPPLGRQGPGLLQHGGGQVHPLHPVSGLGQQHREKARPRSDIQNL